MPRSLTLRLGSGDYAVEPVKVDRKKLYGWTEIEAVDDAGQPCKLVTTDETGGYLLGKGGIGLAVFSPEGLWVERASLVVMTRDGTPAELFPSSYKTGIALDERVTDDEFLHYDISDYYQLEHAPEALLKAVGKSIYRFRYSYGDTYEPSTAFLLRSGSALFMLVGCRNDFEMLCPANDEPAEDDEDATDPDDLDNLDFSMFS